MQPELLIAILAGLGAMLGWGFADFFAKKTIDKIGAIQSLVWAHVFGTLAFLIVAIISVAFFNQPLSLPQSPQLWAGLAFFGALQAFVYLFAYIGFGKGQLAVLNPVFASYAGVAAFVSIAFLGETSSPTKMISLLIIFLGVIMISVDLAGLRSKKLNIVPGLKEVAMASLLAAFWTLGWDQFVGGGNFIIFALLMYSFMTITAIIVAKVQKVDLSPKKINPSVWKFLIAIGIAEMIAYLSISFGFSATSLTSVVALISGAFSLPTLVLAHAFLKEKVMPIQTIGALVIVFGIAILALAFN